MSGKFRVSVNHLEMYIRSLDQDQGPKGDLCNNVINDLLWYFVVIQLQSMRVKLQEQIIIFFLFQLKLSTSFTECIDCILKPEVTLPPDIALRVRTASFVNIYGGEGKNKAANMHQKWGEPIERLDKMFRGKQDWKFNSCDFQSSQVIQQIVQNHDNMLLVRK